MSVFPGPDSGGTETDCISFLPQSSYEWVHPSWDLSLHLHTCPLLISSAYFPSPSLPLSAGASTTFQENTHSSIHQTPGDCCSHYSLMIILMTVYPFNHHTPPIITVCVFLSVFVCKKCSCCFCFYFQKSDFFIHHHALSIIYRKKCACAGVRL